MHIYRCRKAAYSAGATSTSEVESYGARNQSGWIEETKARSWKAHWYEYVRQKSQMRKFEAEAELGKIVSPLNATQSSRRDDRVPLQWFVEHRWQPTVEGNWGPTTKTTNQYFIRAIIAPIRRESTQGTGFRGPAALAQHARWRVLALNGLPLLHIPEVDLR